MTFLHHRPRLSAVPVCKTLLTGVATAAALVASTGTGWAAEPKNPDWQPRIVNGSEASISNHRWQVALLDRRFGNSPRQRYFCSGSRLAPDLVITAGHCVIRYRPNQIGTLRVLSGRTFLNQTGSGQTSQVEQILLPLDSEGRPKYRERSGTASWDVALLKLRNPVTGPVIKLAGDDEVRAGQPGARVQVTGWGVTRATDSQVAKRLRGTGQVLLPDGVCQRDTGELFRPSLMLCLGGPKGHASTCIGDSGGPLASRTTAGRRLVGLTSFGDADCRGNVPSVDTRVSSDPIRGWVGRTAKRVSGVDPIGTGGIPEPRTRWCKVPRLRKRSVPSARKVLRSRGCQLGRVRVTHKRLGKIRRVLVAYLPAGWLAPVGHGINVRVSRR